MATENSADTATNPLMSDSTVGNAITPLGFLSKAADTYLEVQQLKNQNAASVPITTKQTADGSTAKANPATASSGTVPIQKTPAENMRLYLIIGGVAAALVLAVVIIKKK